MKLSEIGEAGVLQKIRFHFPEGAQSRGFGIGDDAAVIPWRDNQSLLVSTDLLMENRHFLRASISASELGHKSLAVNLSDIAAMGGKPTIAFLSVALPGDLSVLWFEDFISGFRSLAEEHQVNLLGGDTTSSGQHIAINVTILGEITSSNIKYRSGARSGDVICVTGPLGDSAAGLRCLIEQKERTDLLDRLILRHHRPYAYVREGQWLSLQESVHAMMDVSDGLDSTLKEIMMRSNCGAKVEVSTLPLSPELVEASERFGWGPSVLAAAGGEDYVLAFTVASEQLEQLKSSYVEKFSTPFFPIGKITADSGNLSYEIHGQPFLAPIRPWNHFD